RPGRTNPTRLNLRCRLSHRQSRLPAALAALDAVALVVRERSATGATSVLRGGRRRSGQLAGHIILRPVMPGPEFALAPCLSWLVRQWFVSVFAVLGGRGRPWRSPD